MAKTSAGLLLYRRVDGAVQVLLAHPGGPFWARRDSAAWSIPKGEIEAGESPLVAARREFAEEMGSAVDGDFIELEPVRQSGGKLVLAWALQADFDVASVHSNSFSMEWPPGSGRQQDFPEVDRAAWLTIAEARLKIIKGQAGLLDQLLQRLGEDEAA
jgi:predicted NUDIX family NTP pyrophosphohydrolase